WLCTLARPGMVQPCSAIASGGAGVPSSIDVMRPSWTSISTFAARWPSHACSACQRPEPFTRPAWECGRRARAPPRLHAGSRRRQALVADALSRGLDPAHERRVVGELVDHRAVGGRDVRGIARQRDPAKRSLALGEQGPDVSRNKAWILERARAAAQARLGAQA